MSGHEFWVPLEFSPAAAGLAEALEAAGERLYYDVRRAEDMPRAGGQARFEGAVVFVPRLNIRDYLCLSSVDKVRFKVSLSKASQRKHVRDKLKARLPSIYVEDRLGESSIPRNADTFWVTVQDPTRGDLDWVNRVIGGNWGRRAPTTIDLIEVAVDWYPRQPSELGRWRMVAALFRHHFLDEFDSVTSLSDLRQFWSKEPGKGPEFVFPAFFGAIRSFSDRDCQKPEVRARILRERRPFEHFLDATVYFGEEEGPVSFRIQNKVEDSRSRDGRSRPLDQWERRARIEVILTGDALERHGLLTLQDLRGFEFEKLRGPYFQFWLPTDRYTRQSGLPPRTYLFKEGGVYSHELHARALNAQKAAEQSPAKRRSASRRGTGKRRRLMAWTELNEQARQALTRLTADWV
jgi:hypothetical protein